MTALDLFTRHRLPAHHQRIGDHQMTTPHGFVARLYHEVAVNPGAHAHVAVSKRGRSTYVRASKAFSKRTRVAAVEVEYDNGYIYTYHFRNPHHALAWWAVLPHELPAMRPDDV